MNERITSPNIETFILPHLAYMVQKTYDKCDEIWSAFLRSDGIGLHSSNHSMESILHIKKKKNEQ